eukprot:gene22133-29195_t
MRQKMKQEAHLFCTLKVATDADLKQQIGSAGQCFDLVNHDNLPASNIFRIRKNLKFTDFKATVAEKLGIPLESQRYWTWQARENGTYRPVRPLRPDEEQLTMVDLREHREMGSQAVNKHAMMDLRLFLETPQQQNPTTLAFERVPGEVPPRGKHDIFLFIKHYDPETEVLRFVCRLNLHRNTKIQDAAKLLHTCCGLPPDIDIDIFEEVQFDPVEVNLLNKKNTLADLMDGEILVVQQAEDPKDSTFRHPTVVQHMEYIRNRKMVYFCKLEDPKEGGISLELMRDMSYDEVTATLAKSLVGVDPTHIRLTQHNAYSHQPQKNPMRFRGISNLEGMLQHANHKNDILYYEILDLPLPELEQLKTLRVSHHSDNGELQSDLTVRLPKESIVADVLDELQRAMENSTDATAAATARANRAYGRELRLMEVYHSKLYKVYESDEGIETINDGYWKLRVEVIPEDQMPDALQEGDQIIHVYHMKMDQGTSIVTCFGDPFLLRISESDTMADLKPRIQSKLGVSDEEFAKWNFNFVSARNDPVQLIDSAMLHSSFSSASRQLLSASEPTFLGLQHEDIGPRREPDGGGPFRSMLVIQHSWACSKRILDLAWCWLKGLAVSYNAKPPNCAFPGYHHEKQVRDTLKKFDFNDDDNLDLSEVTALVEHLIAQEKKTQYLKWAIIFLAVFTVVLLGAMTGLIYAIVAALKDTEVDKTVLVTKSGEVIQVASSDLLVIGGNLLSRASLAEVGSDEGQRRHLIGDQSAFLGGVIRTSAFPG